MRASTVRAVATAAVGGVDETIDGSVSSGCGVVENGVWTDRGGVVDDVDGGGRWWWSHCY